jgi:hypothetical protein
MTGSDPARLLVVDDEATIIRQVMGEALVIGIIGGVAGARCWRSCGANRASRW